MLKRYFLITALIFCCCSSNAQSLSYNQLLQLYHSWMTIKASTFKPISKQLLLIDNQWKLQSTNPSIDGDTKSYFWQRLQTKLDTQMFVTYLQKDADTVKYSVKYLFYNKSLFKDIIATLKVNKKYKISNFTDEAKGEYNVTAFDDISPMASRIDVFLTEYTLRDDDGKLSKCYSVELESRYLTQHLN